MKKLIFCTIALTMGVIGETAGQGGADVRWREVDTLEAHGLYQRALQAVRHLYADAGAQGDMQGKLRALVYELKYRDLTEEESTMVNMRAVDSLAQHAQGTEKALLQSMLAEMYAAYAANNRYRLYSRTPSAGEDPADISTWSLDHLYTRSAALYRASLEPAAPLQALKLRQLQVMVDTGRNTLSLRPTLYDLLAHRALEFFANDEPGLSRPAEQYQIRQAAALGDLDAFLALELPDRDSSSQVGQSLRLYQALLRFHREDSDPAARLDLDLDRLAYVYTHGVIPGKDTLYRDALRRIKEAYGQQPAVAKAYQYLAQWHATRGQAYQAFTHPQGQEELKSALKVCEEAIAAFPGTAAAMECRRLRDHLLRREITLTTEQVNLPGKPFRVLVSYRNARELYFRIVRLPDVPRLAGVSQADKLSRPALRQWAQVFPDPGDHQAHAAEMKVDSLPPGHYALLAATDPAFTQRTDPIAGADFYVSRIAFITNGRGDYFVGDREHGQPLAGAAVQLWARVYDSRDRRQMLMKEEQYSTDRDGMFHVEGQKDYRNYLLEISWHGDHLFAGEDQQWLAARAEETEDTNQARSFLFTDRAIYRPGQTLYFKGITLDLDPHTHRSQVVSGRKALLRLLDGGGQAIDSLELTSNAYGSYAGHFRLPEGRMAGGWRLEESHTGGQVSFSVEAYKRPSFYLDWDTAAAPYCLRDTVRMGGTLSGYNGVPVGQATVRYTVTRLTRMGIPLYRRSFLPWPPPQQVVISQGVTESDAQGHFEVLFPALPDEQADSALQPVFEYQLAVDVTDINGESHPFSRSLSLGYERLQLHWQLPEKISADSLRSLPFSLTDPEGRPLRSGAGPVQVSLYALEAPEVYLRERYWPRPDQHIMSPAEYRRLFPMDAYAGEADPSHWAKKTRLFQTTVSVADSLHAGSTAQLPDSTLPAGWYAAVAETRDRDGRPVKAETILQVYDPQSGPPPGAEPLWTSADALEATPGSRVAWRLALPREARALEQDERVHGARRPQLVGGGWQRAALSLGAEDKGGLVRHYALIWHNRLFVRDLQVKVPYPEAQLHISYESFRDKLLPGAEESWRLKISGPGGEKVSAELLATMYDASLDAFRALEWPALDELYPMLPPQGRDAWRGGGQFGVQGSQLLYQPRAPRYDFPDHSYPSFNWYGFSPGGRSHFVIRGLAMKSRQEMVGNTQDARMADSAAPMAATPSPPAPAPEAVTPRSDLRETAFFLPQLQTDAQGNVILQFRAPEALTRWKVMALAHTPSLQFALSSREVVTSKPLMIQAAAPRFLRQGDSLVFSAKISNLSGQRQEGQATLHLLDAAGDSSLDALLGNAVTGQSFSVDAGGSTVLHWALRVPGDFDGALRYRVTAAAADHSDGEQNLLPVLSNRVPVTESLPLDLEGNGDHALRWPALEKMTSAPGRVNHGLTIEWAANPVWYALQALPSLQAQERESVDALFQRYYADALGSTIAARIPGFQQLVQAWLADSSALQSPLEQNSELKSVLLEETLWVQEAEDETSRKKSLARWFEADRLRSDRQGALAKLQDMQLPGGGFPWFRDMPDDPYMTQRLLTALGRLRASGAWAAEDSAILGRIVAAAVPYADARMKEAYDRQRLAAGKKKRTACDPGELQYLYMRSFFTELQPEDSVRPAQEQLLRLAKASWKDYGPQLQGMIALAAYRSGDRAAAQAILRSLRESGQRDAHGGMHWKEPRSYFWYRQPVETQALLIEAFSETGQDSADVNAMRRWLLAQKRTQRWGSSSATADAIYALTQYGSSWISVQPSLTLALGGHQLSFPEGTAGTGFRRTFIPPAEMSPSMSDIRVGISGAAAGQPLWGALYWQYAEPIDRLQDAGGGMQVTRQVSLLEQGPAGDRLQPLAAGTALRPGDRLQVRLVLKISQDMDYVHLKDLRASCMEPLQTLSGYRWEGGTGYYASATDVAMHFYFPRLRAGTYVFSYPVYVTHAGRFSGGFATLECLYAPAFSAHSEGGRIEVRD